MHQEGTEIGHRPVFLFQDGGRNPWSGEVYASEALVRHNLQLFAQIVPHGVAIPARANLGVALNHDRAERFAFLERAAPAAILFEDDLVPGPQYLRTLDRLIELALAEARVGYVAAYGDPAAPLARQRRHPARLIAMRQNWGFALTRRQWLRQKPLVDQYLRIIRRQDYRHRDEGRIAGLFHAWGLGAPGTSQDVAKAHACLLTGAARVNTFAAFARSIGRHGSEFDPDMLEGLGFGGPEVMEEDIFRLAPPRPAELDRLLAEARRAARGDRAGRGQGRS